MIQPSQREKILIITLSVVLFVVVSFFIWKPLLASWRLTSLQYKAKKQERALMEATLARQPEFEKQYDELKKTMDSPTGIAPVPDVLQKGEQLAGNAGVTIRNRSPQPPRDKGGFTEVAVDYSLEATIETLVKFLYDIRTAQDLLDVTELKVTPTPANPATLRADVRLVSLRAGK